MHNPAHDSGTYFSGIFPVVETPQPSPLPFYGDLTTSLGTLTLALLPALSLWVFWEYMVWESGFPKPSVCPITPRMAWGPLSLPPRPLSPHLAPTLPDPTPCGFSPPSPTAWIQLSGTPWGASSDGDGSHGDDDGDDENSRIVSVVLYSQCGAVGARPTGEE